MTENPDTQPQNETNEETSKEEHKRDIKVRGITNCIIN